MMKMAASLLLALSFLLAQRGSTPSLFRTDKDGNIIAGRNFVVGATVPTAAAANSFGVAGDSFLNNIWSDYGGGVTVATSARGGAMAMSSAAGEGFLIGNWAYGGTPSTDRFARNGASPQIMFSIDASVPAGTAAGDFLFLTTASGTAGNAITWLPIAQFRQVGHHTFVGTLSVGATPGVIPTESELLHVGGGGIFTATGPVAIVVDSAGSASMDFREGNAARWSVGRFGTGDDLGVYSASTGANVLTVNWTSGAALFSNTVRATGGYQAGDGTTGATGTCTGPPTVKNGLVVSCAGI